MSRWSCPNRTALKVQSSLEGAVEGGWQVTREEERRREGKQLIGWTAVWSAPAQTWTQVPSGEQQSEGAPGTDSLAPLGKVKDSVGRG